MSMAVLIGQAKQAPTLLMSIEILEVYICVCVARKYVGPIMRMLNILLLGNVNFHEPKKIVRRTS